MIDPISAVAMATSAFKMVQRMVSAGQEIEETLSHVGRWYGAVSDFNEAKRQAENPPLFKKLIASKSIEQEAMEMFANNKRIQQQEKELRELLMYTYGANAYQELQGMRRSIKEQREKTVYAQARRRKAFVWNSIALSVIGAMGYVLYLMIKAVTM